MIVPAHIGGDRPKCPRLRVFGTRGPKLDGDQNWMENKLAAQSGGIMGCVRKGLGKIPNAVFI